MIYVHRSFIGLLTLPVTICALKVRLLYRRVVRLAAVYVMRMSGHRRPWSTHFMVG